MAIRETGETLDLWEWDTTGGHETEPGKEPTAILRVGYDGDAHLSLPKTSKRFVPLLIEDPCDGQGGA